jgi:hypothetical protein
MEDLRTTLGDVIEVRRAITVEWEENYREAMLGNCVLDQFQFAIPILN